MTEVSGGRHRAPDPASAADLPPDSAFPAPVVNGAERSDIPSRVASHTATDSVDTPTARWVMTPTPPEQPRRGRHARVDDAEETSYPTTQPPSWSVTPPPWPHPSAGRPPPTWPETDRPSSTEEPTTAFGYRALAPETPPATHPTVGPWTTREPVATPESPLVPEPHVAAADGDVAAPTTPVPSSGSLTAVAPAIEVVGVRKVFGDHVAVDDVSFTAAPGTILGLLGPNGAGKTTTVNMLCTLLKPDAGTALINGHDVVGDAAAVRRSIMLTGQFAALDEALTGRENLILFGRLLGLPKAAAARRADELLESFELTEAAGRRVREYSGGMRRRIDIACGLVTAPKVVFLDEPTTGLDPRSRQEVWRLVESLRDQGVTTLLTTQYLEEADVLSDHIVVIDHGRVIADGTAAELKASIGTAFYEVTPRNPDDVGRVRHLLADLGTRQEDVTGDASEHPVTDVSVSVPAPDGASALVEIVRRTTDADVELSDVALRTPTLDEVFLALTSSSNAPVAQPETTS